MPEQNKEKQLLIEPKFDKFKKDPKKESQENLDDLLTEVLPGIDKNLLLFG